MSHFVCRLTHASCSQFMASSPKPEVHNVLHGRQRRTEPRPQITCTDNFGKFGHVIVEMWERTDTQTYKQTYAHRNTSHPTGGEAKIFHSAYG